MLHVWKLGAPVKDAFDYMGAFEGNHIPSILRESPVVAALGPGYHTVFVAFDDDRDGKPKFQYGKLAKVAINVPSTKVEMIRDPRKKGL